MDVKSVKALAKILDEKKLSVIEVVEGDTRIRLERKCGETVSVLADKAEIKTPAPEVKPKEIDQSPVDFNNLKEVKSPMVGVFYAAPAPDAPPFVQVGSKVKKGDVLCIIEAMKLMNEITAEHDGEIVDICVANGDVVEFAQVLFKLF